jgi:hypothetical protein
MGRALINNGYRGRNGLLPLGLQAERLQVEFRSQDGDRVARGSTDSEGYFYIPNLAPGVYYWRSVALEIVTDKKADGMRFAAHFLKAEVQPQTVTYLATLVVEVSKSGEFQLKELHEPEKARRSLARSLAGTGWETREFVSMPQSTAAPPSGKLPGVKDGSSGSKGDRSRSPR